MEIETETIFKPDGTSVITPDLSYDLYIKNNDQIQKIIKPISREELLSPNLRRHYRKEFELIELLTTTEHHK